MQLLKKLLNKFNGLHFSQEYLCISSHSFQSPLEAWLVTEKQTLKNITHRHLFIGYSPLIIALFALEETESVLSGTIDIFLTNKILQPNAKFDRKDAIAVLTLKRVQPPLNCNDSILYFEGQAGKHQFVSLFHQWIIGINNQLSNKKPGNVFLGNNLYKQVQIAYSLPRNISLITVEEGGKYNLFPTDLHGQANEHLYIISLRHEGKACTQVMQSRRILVCEVESQYYKTVYALGKNHMQDYKEKSFLPFSDSVSSQLRLPIPEPAIFCRELELQDSFIHGIHRILLFKILSGLSLRDNPSPLAHIHNVYATWRHNNRLSGNYLLR